MECNKTFPLIEIAYFGLYYVMLYFSSTIRDTFYIDKAAASCVVNYFCIDLKSKHYCKIKTKSIMPKITNRVFSIFHLFSKCCIIGLNFQIPGSVLGSVNQFLNNLSGGVSGGGYYKYKY